MDLVVAGSGVLVEGDKGVVEAFAARLAEVIQGKSGRSVRISADGLAALANLNSLVSAHRDYFEFSADSLRLLREMGAIPAENGFFRSFVKDGGRFAGNLEWAPVNLGAEQALAMQTMAAQLALRAAIKDVTAAIERVEGKVDKLLALAKAQRLGAAVGQAFTLRRMAERVRAAGRVSRTDWSTVDHIGHQIIEDLASFREYVYGEISDSETMAFVRTRSGELKDLSDEMLRQSLALIVVAEQNLSLWHEIKIAHVAAHEPEALESTVADARSEIAELSRLDQHMLDSMYATAQELLAPTGFEGFTPLERHRLRGRAAELDDLIEWFADQRLLDSTALVAEFPGFRDGVELVRDTAVGTARAAGGAIASGAAGLKARVVRSNRDEGDEAGIDGNAEP